MCGEVLTQLNFITNYQFVLLCRCNFLLLKFLLTWNILEERGYKYIFSIFPRYHHNLLVLEWDCWMLYFQTFFFWFSQMVWWYRLHLTSWKISNKPSKIWKNSASWRVIRRLMTCRKLVSNGRHRMWWIDQGRNKWNVFSYRIVILYVIYILTNLLYISSYQGRIMRSNHQAVFWIPRKVLSLWIWIDVIELKFCVRFLSVWDSL